MANINFNDFSSRLSTLGLNQRTFAEIANVPYGTVRNWGSKTAGLFTKKLPSWVPAFLDMYERAKALQPYSLNPTEQQLKDFHRMHVLIEKGVPLAKDEILFLLRRVHGLYEWICKGLAQSDYMKTIVDVMETIFTEIPEIKEEPYYISKFDISGQCADVDAALAYLRGHLDTARYFHPSLIDTVSRCPEVALRDMPADHRVFKALAPFYRPLFEMAKRSYLMASGSLYQADNLELGEDLPTRPKISKISRSKEGVYLYTEKSLSWRVFVNEDFALFGNYLQLESLAHSMEGVEFESSSPTTPLYGQTRLWTTSDSYNVALGYSDVEVWLGRKDYDKLHKAVGLLWNHLEEHREWFSAVWGAV